MTETNQPSGSVGPNVKPSTGPGPGSEQGTLLVVDDNPNNRDILKRHIEKQGFRVMLASNGRLALELLAQHAFDLVLLDLMMPELDGFEVLQRMKASPTLNSTPVIMISALDETSSVVRCVQMGAEDYLAKPFDPVLLNARIHASLEKKRLRDREHKKTAELEEAIAELRRTQDQLVVQEKLASLGALTAGIAHEIRNPLNFVTNFASVSADLLSELRQAWVDQSTSKEDVASLLDLLQQNIEKIEEHGKRADRIVRGMLMHSRTSSGQMESTDLNALLTDSINLAYHGLRARDTAFNVTIETDLDPDLPRLRAIPQDLSRVFINIINNACYAAHERKKHESKQFSPRVQVQSRAAHSWVEVRVRDNGSGIDPEALPKIFNPFFTTKPAGAGTGLGLSISYDIVVREHKGELRAESARGDFTEFIITLPCCYEEAG